jgi:DHA1 family tetracycline resistance protein-like MFS transporter
MSSAGPRSRASLGVVYATVFIDLLGFGIILPALPYYAERLGAGGLGLGVILTSYSFAQLVGAAILGRLSDRFGRRPVILISLAGSAISLGLTGLASTLVALAAARGLAGAFGGSIAAAQAYIADVTRPDERARFMGYLGAATGLGFVLGPALGAGLSRWGFAAASFAAAGLAATNFLFAIARLRESRPTADRGATGRRPTFANLRRALGHSGLRPLLVATFLTAFAFVGMETTLAYLGEVRFALDERLFGLLLVLAGIVVIAVQGGLIGRLTRRFGERRVAVGGGGLMALTLAGLPFCGGFSVAAALVAVMAAGRALTLPTLSALVSRMSEDDEQGGTLGLSQALAAAARAVGPLTAGWLYDLRPEAPYLLGALVSALGAAVVFSLPEPGETADI